MARRSQGQGSSRFPVLGSQMRLGNLQWSHVRYFCLFLLLIGGFAASATEFGVAPEDAPVYHEASIDSTVLFQLEKGERIAILKKDEAGGFLRIAAKRNGKWRSGYIEFTEIEPYVAPKVPNWGLGGGVEYDYLTQGGRSFETNDQIQWTTSKFTSTGTSPFLTLQYKRDDFYRLTLAYKLTHFTSATTTNVVGPGTQPVNLQHTFLSALLQKAWTPFKKRPLYVGVGVEAAEAIAVSLNIGGTQIQTSSQDLPFYLGLQGFVGGQWSLGSSVSLFLEGRFQAIVDQSPIIYDYEPAAGLLIWL